MLERCPDAIYVGTAELKGWRLLFKGSQSGSYLTIEKKKGRKVPVLVWKVSKRDEKKLDAYEGAPRFYQKEEMEVELHNLADGAPIGTVKAFIYIMDENRRTGQPDDWYYYTCEEGYLRFGFDTAILKIAYEESTGKKRGGAR